MGVIQRATNKAIVDGVEYKTSGQAIIVRPNYGNGATRPSKVLKDIRKAAERFNVCLMAVEHACGNFNGRGVELGEELPSAFQAVAIGTWGELLAFAKLPCFEQFGERGATLVESQRVKRAYKGEYGEDVAMVRDRIDPFAPTPKDISPATAKRIDRRRKGFVRAEELDWRDDLMHLPPSDPNHPHNGEADRIMTAKAERVVLALWSGVSDSLMSVLVPKVIKYFRRHGEFPTKREAVLAN